MPDVRNCRRCGRIYNYIGGAPLCPDCRKEDEEDFAKVKQYLYDNPKATVSQVSSELEISVEKIKRFLKEGRLEIVGDDGNMILECESCGRAIKTGRFCELCEKNLSNNFKSMAGQISETLNSELEAKRNQGLRYLNKEDGLKKFKE